MRILPIPLGLPSKLGVDLLVRVMPFDTNATTGSLYFEVKNDLGERLAEGNIALDEAEFAPLKALTVSIEDLALAKLGVTRDLTPTTTTSSTTFGISTTTTSTTV